MSKKDIIKRYLSLLESFNCEEKDFSAILDSTFVQVEYPNILNREGQKSNFSEILQRVALGKKMLSKQAYKVVNFIEQGNQVVVEAEWSGTMAIDAGVLKAGSQMKAMFCFVCEFKEEKIVSQRNYDCFFPF
ncbi:MAG: nuclear transport factor 2 family protein [Bacteriovoracia bacterium]